jgi:hypothetical protein
MESPDVKPPSAAAARSLGPQLIKSGGGLGVDGVATSMAPVAIFVKQSTHKVE